MAEPLVGWPEYQRWRSQFVAMLDPRFYTPLWLDQQVMSGKFRLFTSDDSAILCSVAVYPTGLKEVQGEAAVGNLASIRAKTIPQAIEWAKSVGCRSAVIQSRQGWSKVLKQDGFEVYQTALRKAL